MRTKLSRSAIFAVNCASWACKWESCRGFCEGTVLRRELAGALERGRFDMAAFWSRFRAAIYSKSVRVRDSLLVDLFVVRVGVGDASQHILVGLPRRKGLAVPRLSHQLFHFSALLAVTTAHRNTAGQRHYLPDLEAMTTHQAVRRWIMTGAVAAITVTGTIYGADLKGYQDAKQVCRCPLVRMHASMGY